jgi:hypothetical protein
MDITVTSPAPVVVETTTASPSNIEIDQKVVTADVVARTVQPEAAGFFIEYLGNDNYTIWIEDGE